MRIEFAKPEDFKDFKTEYIIKNIEVSFLFEDMCNKMKDNLRRNYIELVFQEGKWFYRIEENHAIIFDYCLFCGKKLEVDKALRLVRLEKSVPCSNEVAPLERDETGEYSYYEGKYYQIHEKREWEVLKTDEEISKAQIALGHAVKEEKGYISRCSVCYHNSYLEGGMACDQIISGIYCSGILAGYKTLKEKEEIKRCNSCIDYNNRDGKSGYCREKEKILYSIGENEPCWKEEKICPLCKLESMKKTDPNYPLNCDKCSKKALEEP